jgi:hypothetical protein
MSDKKANPIPTRYDEETTEKLERINKATGIPTAEIIRRAVKFALDNARDERSLEFLLGDRDMIEEIFGPLEEDGKSKDKA